MAVSGTGEGRVILRVLRIPSSVTQTRFSLCHLTKLSMINQIWEL